jgi:hypothetical protein
MWVIVDTEVIFWNGYSYTLAPRVSDETVPVDPNRLPFTATLTDKYGTLCRAPLGSFRSYVTTQLYYDYKYQESITAVVTTEYYNVFFGRWLRSHQSELVGFFGTGVAINNYLSEHQRWNRGRPFEPPGEYPSVKLTVTATIPLVPQKLPLLAPPTGNKPPMKDCCEDVLAALEDIKEAWDIDRMLKDKFPVANTFMAPECTSDSTTDAKTYYEVMQCVFRVLAHGLIFEPKVMLKDADAAKPGDQEFKTKYLNATGWASAVSEALLEVKDDGNVATNMDIRNGFAVSQLMIGVADAHYKIDAILDCMGIRLGHLTPTVETPYNLMVRVGKGFGKDSERQLDLNQDEATESLLPEFLQTKENKIKTVIIHPRSRTLLDILENIEESLSRPSNGT